MPPKELFDISGIDTSKIIIDRDEIAKVNPHRFEFRQLDGVCYMNEDHTQIVGIRQPAADEFWVRGHIPGRPIFPGVLMIETAAQLVSYCMASEKKEEGFLGFGGVTDVKFRGSVAPGDRIVVLGLMIDKRPRRCVGATQGYVDGRMVFEATITGMWF
ncbi:MAG: 3-hydroxyacyl-ACP dehydratase FabZ family protein [Planctomycetaceae bacterium]